MLPFTNKELKPHDDVKVCYICRKCLEEAQKSTIKRN